MRGIWLDKALLNASLHINVCWLWAEVLLDKEKKKLVFVMRGKSMRDSVKDMRDRKRLGDAIFSILIFPFSFAS